jgi:cation transport ATPase
MGQMTPAKSKPEEKKKEAQPPATPTKAEKKPKKEKAKKQKDQNFELPLLVEIGFSFAGIFLVLVNLVVAYISFTSGATWTDIFLRVVVTTIAVGFVLWMLVMNISNGSLAAAIKTIEEEETKHKGNGNEDLNGVDVDIDTDKVKPIEA